MFSIELKLFWLMIDCLERLVLKAKNMVSLWISKKKKKTQQQESEIETVFEKRFKSKFCKISK